MKQLAHVSLLVGLACTGAARADDVRFNRDVRPILTENCFHCHGPDPSGRKAELRLDREDALHKATDSGNPVVTPGKPALSDLYTRVTSTDEDEVMPPPKSHKTLKPAERETLKRWIEQGAKWEGHWAFIAPQRPATPAVKDVAWAKNPIDQFVLAKLEAAGLKPAAEADRRALARRAALDVIGLPPEPADVEAYLADKSPDAYEKYVDRLLASPQYGEHRARYWLDAARYADTHGLHFDNYREMWPYRQWVIEAFNRNQPFDQFTVEQLAGDLLPNHSLDQQIATGFHRCNITSNEGGSISAELEAIYAKDRVETTSAVWLGLTAQCSACHDHKFDPITQRDYYSMSAYFRNTVQPAMDGNIPDTPPMVVLPPADRKARWEALTARAKQVTEQKAARRKEMEPAFTAWLSGGERGLTAPLVPGTQAFAMAIDAPVAAAPAEPTCDVQTAAGAASVNLPANVTWGDGPRKKTGALHFGKDGTLVVPNTESFNGDSGFTVSMWIRPSKTPAVIVSKIDTKEKLHGWKVEQSARGDITVTILGDSPTDKLVVKPNQARISSDNWSADKWSHLTVTYDGSRLAKGVTIFINGKAFVTGPGDVTELKGTIAGGAPVRLGSDGTPARFESGALRDVRLFSRGVSLDEATVLWKWDTARAALAKAPAKISAPERADLALLYAVQVDKPFVELNGEMLAAEREMRQIRHVSAITHVMQEKMDAQPTAHILNRGQYDQERDEVKPAIFTSLHPLPKDASANRLGLAKWIVDPANPLMARVTVNRYWQEVFGAGIVRTSDDFGIMGEAPSNQALLDWLAVEFRESKWDVKHMIRLMVTSATYRQSAAVTAEKVAKDPANRLLSRGPRFRMDAEMVRDAALAESGLLVKKLGGPSARPYQPDGVWEAVAMPGSNTREYKRDTGDGLYRRSLYTFWKRAAPPANMDVFNAPTRENCTVRRERTDTPLQALVTMNDTQFVEAARVLAERAIKNAGDVEGRINFISGRILSRPMRGDEVAILSAAQADLAAHYREHADEAKKLAAVGDFKRDEAIDASELAAWTMVVNQVMNLDESLNK